jgi:alpha-mannosidase
MRDYLNRLYESIQDSVKLQQQTIELLIQASTKHFHHNFIISELERDNFNRMPRKTPSQVSQDKSVEVALFNSLAQERMEIVLLRVLKPNVKIVDSAGNELPYQINPVFNVTEHNDTQTRRIVVSNREFELMFLAKLPPLSLTVFTVSYQNDTRNKIATIYCEDCKDEVKHNESDFNPFDIKPKQSGDIQVENSKMRLLFDGESGFLKSMTKKNWGKAIQLAIKFGAYKSAQFHSGAYLFRPESSDPRNAEKDVFESYKDKKIMITTGPIASDVSVIHGAFLAHTVRIFKTQTHLDTAMYIENDIDFESPPKNRETEMFMRFITSIENGDDPEFYSDLNGFQWQPRKKVQEIGIEGNYFPITTSAFIQDNQMRLTLMTTHAQGAASLEPGQLEVMLDRRTLYDDYRGMGEGVVDSRLMRHQFWLTMEFFDSENGERENSAKTYNVPSLHAQHLSNALNYPTNIYFIENYDETQKIDLNKHVELLSYQLPCDLHIVNLRTLTENNLPLFPSKSALFIVQRFGYDCRLSSGSDDDESYANKCSQVKGKFSSLRLFKDVELEDVQRTTLTALKALGSVKSFSGESQIEPMELRTYNMTFV